MGVVVFIDRGNWLRKMSNQVIIHQHTACEVRLQPLFKKKERRWQALGRGSNLAPMPQPKKRWIRYVFVHPFDVPLPPHITDSKVAQKAFLSLLHTFEGLR